MAWVQINSRKINTAMLCFMEQHEEKLRLYFEGQQQALELQPDEARALWKFLKAEDIMAMKDKGSAMVLPKRWGAMPDVAAVAGGKDASSPSPAAAPVAVAAAAQQPKPASSGHGSGSSHPQKPQVSVTTSGSSSHRPHSSHSQSHSHQHPKPAQVLHKTAEVKKA